MKRAIPTLYEWRGGAEQIGQLAVQACRALVVDLNVVGSVQSLSAPRTVMNCPYWT
jgi:hypothetical protein